MKIQPLLASFLERIHVAAYVQDDNGRLIYLNPAATRLTGWRLTEVIGRCGHDIFGGSQVCPCQVCRGGATGLPPGVLEGTIRTRSGVWMPVRVGVSPVALGSGAPGTVVMIEDLNPTCPAETQPSNTGRQSSGQVGPTDLKRFVDSLFESISDGISVLDPDLTVRRVNPIMADWYADRMPLVGRRCYECYQGRIGPCSNCPTLRCLNSGKVEHEIVTGPPGSPIQRLSLISFPLKDPASGQVCQVVEFVRDITANAHLENVHRLVSELAEKIRGLRRALNDTPAPGPTTAGQDAMSWASQADVLVNFCDQILARWPEVEVEGKPPPSFNASS